MCTNDQGLLYQCHEQGSAEGMLLSMLAKLWNKQSGELVEKHMPDYNKC